jgi:transposase
MTSTTGLIAAEPPSEPTLIKTDVLGRVKHSREQRERILDEYERSGVSGPKFAALVGVKYQTFATWLQKRKRRQRKYSQTKRAAKTPAQLKWFEAVVRTGTPTGGGGAGGLLLHFPGGVRAELTSNDQVALAAALVAALEKPC